MSRVKETKGKVVEIDCWTYRSGNYIRTLNCFVLFFSNMYHIENNGELCFKKMTGYNVTNS